MSALNSTTATCELCCDTKAVSDICVLQRCGHEQCKECLVKWTEKAESAGYKSHPGCPFCRVEMTDEETLQVLGRPFRPATMFRHEENTLSDDLTLQWLMAHCKPCPRCGLCIEKEEGTCAMMECICGYRFCYDCQTQNADCSCSPANHRFWNNIVNRPYRVRAKALGMAPTNLRTGEIDLSTHISVQKKQYEVKIMAQKKKQGLRRRMRELAKKKAAEKSSGAGAEAKAPPISNVAKRKVTTNGRTLE